MKRVITAIAIFAASALLLMGCSSNNNQESSRSTGDDLLDNKNYITKDEIEIPQKGKLTVLTHGISQDDEGKDVYKISLKLDMSNDVSKVSSYFQQNNKGILKSSTFHLGSGFKTMTLDLIDDTTPITFTIRENGEALVKRNYYLDA